MQDLLTMLYRSFVPYLDFSLSHVLFIHLTRFALLSVLRYHVEIYRCLDADSMQSKGVNNS